MTLKKITSLFKKEKSAITYTGSSLFNFVAQIVSSIIVLSYIQPDKLGIWNSLLLFETYALFLQVGIVNGLSRELPFYLGKNDREFAESLAANALYFSLWSIGLCLVIGIGFLFYNHDKDIIFKLTFIGILIITINKFYENYLASTFRSNHSFVELAKVYLMRGIYLIISILLVIYFGYIGYIIRMVSTSIFVSVMMHFIRPINVKPSFNLSHTKLLLKVGMPIFLLAYIYNASATIDRLLLAKFSGFKSVGLYSLGLMTFNAFKMLPLSIANYIYPKMSFAYGKTHDVLGLIKKALKINLIILSIMFPLAISGYFILPLIIPILFPKYLESIKAAQILLFAAVLSGFSIGANVLWSLKIWKYITIIQLGGALLNVSLIYLFFNLLENPIIGISIGVLSSQLGYVVLTNFLIYITGRNERYSK